MTRPLSAWTTYAIAVAAAAAGLATAFLLRNVLEPGVFPPFLVAVTVSALYGGVGPALVTTALSLVASYVFLLAPLYSFASDESGLSRLLLYRMGTFVVASLLIIAMATARTRAIGAMRRARAETEEARRRMAFLAEASNVLGRTLDYDDTLASVVRLAVPFLADWCSVDVCDADGAIRRVAVSHADPSKTEMIEKAAAAYPPDPLGRHPRTIALRTGRSQLITEVTDDGLKAIATSDEQLAILRALAYRSAMVVPLVARGETLGVMTFAMTISDRRYGVGDLALAEDLARRCALAVDNARLYREAQDANRTKDRFLAMVSHELRSPLNAVVTWAHLLRTGRLDDAKAKRAVAAIERSGQLQVRLIGDLLDVARISSGKLHLERGLVDLRGIVEGAIDVARPEAETKHIRLVLIADADRAMVQGDAARLQQVLGNLLGNAVKFTPDGGMVTVEIATRPAHARVAVQDSGVGIPTDQLPRIFEPFQQAGESAVREGGLGLGLAISKHIVELHGGTIVAESAGEGCGSRFVVTLPLDTSAAEPESEPRTGVGGAR